MRGAEGGNRSHLLTRTITINSTTQMNSQVTLVDSSSHHPKSPQLGASSVLRFDRDSIHNTTLHAEKPGGPSYLVRSDKYATSTTVSRVDEDGAEAVVGVVNRRSVLPDTIVLAGEKMRLGRWLVSTSSSQAV